MPFETLPMESPSSINCYIRIIHYLISHDIWVNLIMGNIHSELVLMTENVLLHKLIHQSSCMQKILRLIPMLP